MLNEWTEFLQYTSPVCYTAMGKRDNSYLGRFTYTTLTDFEGMARILTILARGYLFHDENGNVLDGKPKDRIELARHALLAWCSIPDTKKATPKEEWQYKTDFREYSNEFPSLVDDNGSGWFYRHVHGIIDFVRDNPALVSKTAQNNCEALANGFDKEWRNKVKQFQTPIFSRSTKGAWVLRFAYFGSTNFSHKWLVKIPDAIMTREKQSFGVCRYKENI